MKSNGLTLYDLEKKFPNRNIAIRDTEDQLFTTHIAWNWGNNFVYNGKRKNFSVEKIENKDRYQIHVLVKESIEWNNSKIDEEIAKLLND
ncbi:hypothetical protein [uncultured Succinivibrio sp.]|uniref:hypothetical protein n=1 Tax=uncultured Succinivibrio sp. TaxID=540749 RepID=UPI0025DBD4AB|nr:hypothetical protein [uncultured Succinivibrio sp.]